MSVQVRRRREAASFLSTYVGAQGELLVDTTNNRVQVHDGVTPGGWPAAAIGDLTGRNAILNGNFAINQRAYPSGSALAANAYAHDRWKAGSGGCTYTFTPGTPDTSVAITAGTLVQVVEGANVSATSFWLTWTGTATARAWQGSAGGSYVTSPLLVAGLTLGTAAAVEFSTGTVGLVQLAATLPNAGPTRFERRLLAQELALCQRYYQTLQLAARGPATASGQIYETPIFFPVPMRAAPATAYLGGGQRTNATVQLLSLTTMGGRFVIFSQGSGDAYAVADPWSFNAEL